jgi:hypothetical protein
MNNVQLPCADHVKNLGLHLDRKFTWHHNIFKRMQIRLTFTKMYWLLGHRSQLSLRNKLLLYKTILKPIWTYGIQLWGTASTSNIDTGTLSIEYPVHNSRCTLVCAEHSHPSRPITDIR